MAASRGLNRRKIVLELTGLGMDPGSPLCDPFYEAADELDIPLLVHAGAELAVHGGNTEDYGNQLRLSKNMLNFQWPEVRPRAS
jgi:predicted TIM-barrel fold metal-dependent hydrolase